MIINSKYGPQFDPTDGTVGKIQLSKRWVIVRKSDGQMWEPRQGRYTFVTEEEARERMESFVANSSYIPKEGLDVAAVWCWPRHFDPCGFVKSPAIKEPVYEI